MSDRPSPEEVMDLYGMEDEQLAAGVSDLKDEEIIHEMQSRGYRVDKPIPVERRVMVGDEGTERVTLGVVSDTHLCSKYQQLTHLKESFRLFSREKVDAVVHVGDLVHGHHKMHRGMEYEMFVYGADAQVEYATEHMPRVDGVPQYIISGNHDLSFWKDSGTDVVSSFCDRREDWEYLGPEGAYLDIGSISVYLFHGGTKAHAKSWNLQKMAESVSPEAKPHVLLAGHLHFRNHSLNRNIECLQLPCYQAQTPFEKRKRLTPDVGGVILDLWVSEHGLEDVATRWITKKRVIENDY